MKNLVFVLLILSFAGFFLFRHRQLPVRHTNEQIQSLPEAAQAEYQEVQIQPKAHEVNSSAGSGPKVSSQPGTGDAGKEAERTLPNPVATVEFAAESGFSTGDYADQMFELKELSAKRPPPGPNEAKVFRGLYGDRENKVKYIEMRFEGNQWIVLTGNTLDQLRPWSRRDIVPFLNRPDEWTLYLDKSEGLFLKYLPKVNIPELNGDFEVLSGWLATPTTLTHVAMIGFGEGWPAEAVVSKLFPTRPNR